MREKLLAGLKAKFQGLSNEFMGLLADKGLAKVTEESQIEGFLTELENLPIPVKDFAAFLQKEGDRRVTEAKKKWDEEHKKTDTSKQDADKDKDKDKDDPTALLLKKFTELEQKLAGFDAAKAKEAAQAKLAKALADKKIPARFAKGRSVEKEEDVEALVAEIETDYTEFKQELINEGLVVSSQPTSGNLKAGKADDKEVESIVDNMLPNF